jgi:hypothetical protein
VTAVVLRFGEEYRRDEDAVRNLLVERPPA